MMRKTSGPKRKKITGEWRRLHTEELHELYFLPNIICMIISRRIAWAGHVVRMGERKVAFVGRKLRRLRYRKEHIIMDIQERGWGCGRDCSGSGQR